MFSLNEMGCDIKFQPVIKWSGSKRNQVNQILKYFPEKIETYYEPFCGGCSVLRGLLDSDIKVGEYHVSDLNADLISAWEYIKDKPKDVSDFYREFWQELNKDSDVDRKRDFYNEVRDRLNKEHNPLDFICIMRVTVNGLPRYNSDGEFNNAFHLTREGILPDTFAEIVKDWSRILNRFNVQFSCKSYEQVNPKENDFMYLDPPYANTNGMYFGGFDVERFFSWLREQVCAYVFSFDGITTYEDNTYAVPTDLYDQHLYLESGNSSFRRIIGKSNDCNVQESLYVKGILK